MAQKDLARLSANLTTTGQHVRISNVTDPTLDSDAVNYQFMRQYVEHHGGNTPPAHVGLSVSFNSSAVSVGDMVSRRADVEVTHGTFVSITDAQSSQGSVTVNNNSVTVDTDSASSGSIHLTFVVNYMDEMMQSYSHNESFTIQVREKWYAGISETEPTVESDLIDRGPFVVGSSIKVSNGTGAPREMYAFIPNANVGSAMFETTQGFFIPFELTDVNTGTHRLISFGTIEAQDTNDFVVSEV